MAMALCAVCGNTTVVVPAVQITVDGYELDQQYSVFACRGCFEAFNAMLEAQAHEIQLRLPGGITANRIPGLKLI